MKDELDRQGMWPAVQERSVGRRYVSLRVTIFLLVLLAVACAIQEWVMWTVARPCRACRHPPHVERTCGAGIRAEGFQGSCSCKEDR